MQALKYSQVYLKPNYSVVRSRAEVDLSVEFLGRRFALPIVPSNMQAVINEELAHWLSENDYPYIFHRFGDTRAFIQRANREKWKMISISVGVKEVDKELLNWVATSGLRLDWICVDIAHGHSVLMKEMIEFIRGLQSRVAVIPAQDFKGGTLYSPSACGLKIIAGNVATPEGVKDLTSWGADCVKVNVGPGRACSTKVQTGFHVPAFTCALNCAEAAKADFFIRGAKDIPLIFDGGIRENGDIAKALVAGRGRDNLVMLGSVLAACKDAPGENVYEETRVYTNEITAEEGGGYPSTGIYAWKTRKTGKILSKRYWGSASSRQKGEKRHEEGFEVDLACNGLTYAEKYQQIRESLSSAVSYAGGTNLKAFANVTWMEAKE